MAESVTAKITATVVGGLLLAIAIAVILPYVSRNLIPEAAILPQHAEVRAGEEVIFSARGSKDPDGSTLTVSWNLLASEASGAPDSPTPAIANCATRDDGFAYACRLGTPGHYLVSLIVVDASGGKHSASAELVVDERSPLNAALSPTFIEAEIAESVPFSGAGSSDPDGGPVELEWTIGEVRAMDSSQADCTIGAAGVILTCRFTMPGWHSVGLRVASNDGRTASASAQAKIIGTRRTVGFVARFPGAPKAENDAARVMLWGINWANIQSGTQDLILLWDPDRRENIRADSVEPDLDKARAALEAAPEPHEIILRTTVLPFGLISQIAADLSTLGIQVQAESTGGGNEGLKSDETGFIILNDRGDVSIYYQ